jgi:hypothetical protein
LEGNPRYSSRRDISQLKEIVGIKEAGEGVESFGSELSEAAFQDV